MFINVEMNNFFITNAYQYITVDITVSRQIDSNHMDSSHCTNESFDIITYCPMFLGMVIFHTSSLQISCQQTSYKLCNIFLQTVFRENSVPYK